MKQASMQLAPPTLSAVFPEAGVLVGVIVAAGVDVEGVSDGVARVAAGDVVVAAGATVTASFMPPTQWPAMPQMK
jgi:hypothetical protein